MNESLIAFLSLSLPLVCVGWFSSVALAATAQTAEPGELELVETLEAKGAYATLQEPHLFVTSGVKPKAQPAGYWLDITTNPASPVLVNATLPAAWDVAVSGNFAYVCDYTKFLTVYDIQGGRWQPVAKLEMPSETENIVIRDHLAYIANHNAGLTIVDIATPAKPSIVGAINPQIDCDGIALWQDCAILYAHWQSRLVLVDILDPATPRQLGVYQHDPKTFNQGEIEVSDGFAFCTSQKGLVIVNVNDTANPKLVKVVDLGVVNDVIVRDGYAFVALKDNGVRVLDVRDPVNPVEIGSYKGYTTSVAVKREADDYTIYAARGGGRALVLRFHAN